MTGHMRTYRLFASASAAALLLLLPPVAHDAHAQKVSKSTQPASAFDPMDAAPIKAKCRDAADAIRRGPTDPQFTWGVGHSKTCGASGANVAADGLGMLRALRDTVALDSLTSYFGAWRDARVYSAGVDLATDDAASAESRVFAIRYLYSTVMPGARVYGYGVFARASDNHCVGSATVSGEFEDGRALPTNYVTRLRNLGKQLMNSATAPSVVKLAAGCLTYIPAGFQPQP